jgi:phage terminase large subunit-like protein
MVFLKQRPLSLYAQGTKRWESLVYTVTTFKSNKGSGKTVDVYFNNNKLNQMNYLNKTGNRT